MGKNKKFPRLVSLKMAAIFDFRALTKLMYISYYKLEGHCFRHGRQTAPTFCTHVRIEARLALT